MEHSGTALITIRTLPCTGCGKVSEVTVDSTAYAEWQRGKLIQDAFPSMPPEERELLITGTHGKCWDKMFAEEER